MRAVTKLERRFKRALAVIEGQPSAPAEDSESDALRSELEAAKAENSDATRKIAALAKDLKSNQEKLAKAEAEVATLGDAAGTLQAKEKELESASAEAAKLKKELDAAQALNKNVDADAPAKIATLQDEVFDLTEKLKVSEASAENFSERLRGLRASLRQVRAGIKDNSLAGEDVNTAMQRELEVLQSQRESDLSEVNAILAKIKPLVEGK